MLRIRKKVAVILCAVCVTIFLLLYLVINFSIPVDKQQNIRNIESKLKQLEKGLNIHHNELGHLKQRIETMDSGYPKKEPNEFINSSNKLSAQLKIREVIEGKPVSDLNEKCAAEFDSVPYPDIQMLQLYNDLSFDNPDGGPWKQGWRIEYDPLEFNNHHKLKVFVVPHSHNDPGWIKTFDVYYEHDTKHILSNMLRHLTENPEMKFIWAEISYFSRFYENLGEKSKEAIRELVKNGQLEFVSGGWVMPDEANSHWLSLLIQLREGQHWLKKHLNITPSSAWAIDPFGHSPTMPYLLKMSGIKNLLIQRSHYSVKKRLAQNKQLEFRWRQLWDSSGHTELFTHMMPFYSYDIPHTCGPDPKVCCQFDFKRLPGFGLTCPWGKAPQQITEENVAKKSELIVDQWKKKSKLFGTRSILIPLGDDFRYSQSTEWEAQRQNYEKIFEHINNEPKYFTEAKFSTLKEYFDSVMIEKDLDEFPSLSGDFFTYADRDDHYWSGYYTSRPFHKHMDRILLHYIRSAEMLHSWNKWEKSAGLQELLENSRRQLSLFQHHDGITGTAKTHVVKDYYNRMNEAIRACKFVMQQSAYRLLTNPTIYVPDPKFTYFYLDESRWPGADDGRTTIILGEELPTKHVVFHNSLSYWRDELVELYVSKPFVYVTNYNNTKIPSQVGPIWSWHKGFSSISVPQSSTTKYRLLFKVRVPPLGLATYIIHSAGVGEQNIVTTFSKNLILTSTPFSVNMGDYPTQIEYAEHQEISLHMTGGPIITVTKLGLLKSIAISKDSSHVPTHLEFVKYGTRLHGGNSGAYLFLPDGPAVPLIFGNPTVMVNEGILESSITVGLPFGTHQVILRGNAIEIRNYVDIGSMDNTEIAMRISTGIKNSDTFYTDLNGLSIIKRKIFEKLPLQANYFPVPSTLYIEDENVRLTLLSAQPLGGSSLKSGQIEIMQDRRLAQDDERGLGQGILDNQPVLHIFRLVFENMPKCIQRTVNQQPFGFMTKISHEELQSMLHPIDKMIYAENDWIGAKGSFGEDHESISTDLQVALLRNIPPISGNTENKLLTGLIIHRTSLQGCNADKSVNSVNIKHLCSFNDSKMFSSNLTLLQKNKMTTAEIIMCPMDTKAFIIER